MKELKFNPVLLQDIKYLRNALNKLDISCLLEFFIEPKYFEELLTALEHDALMEYARCYLPYQDIAGIKHICIHNDLEIPKTIEELHLLRKEREEDVFQARRKKIKNEIKRQKNAYK